jgi:glycosyltransferase involved in cell wall biosynthesis
VEDRLRICIFALMYSPLVGGAEVRAEKYAKQLTALGHEVTVVTLCHGKNWKKNEILDSIPVIRIGGIYKSDGTLRIGRLGHFPPDILLFSQIWKLRHKFDLFYCSELSPQAVVIALIGKIMHKPVVISIPSTPPRPDNAMLMADTLTDTEFLKVPVDDTIAGHILAITETAVGGKAMLKFIQNSDVYLQTLSRRSGPYLQAHGFSTRRMVYIPGSVDTEKFCPPDRRPDPAQPERDIVCVARMEYPKGIDILLHAWSRMMKEPAEWRANLKPRLLIAGTGTLEEKIHRIAAELDLQESVKFLGLHRNPSQLLQQAWGFVLPSRWEGMPNALLEAMSCGLPCVATRVSGCEDVVEDGVSGLLVEAEQPAEMARALRRIIEDTELAQSLGQEAREAILRDYQLSHIVDRLVAFYRYILNGRRDTANTEFACESSDKSVDAINRVPTPNLDTNNTEPDLSDESMDAIHQEPKVVEEAK